MSLVKSPEMTGKDSNQRRLWFLTTTLMKVRRREPSQKDVKNEERTGDVYEKQTRS
jgi:hypothetical protein